MAQGSSIDKLKIRLRRKGILRSLVYIKKILVMRLFFFIIKNKIDLLWLVEDLFANYLWLFYLTKNEFLHKGT